MPSELSWKARSLLETMNGEGRDLYRRVAFLLRRTEKLAGYMMEVEMKGLMIEEMLFQFLILEA